MMEKVHVITPSGFECDISPDIFDDMELLDDMAAVDLGEVHKLRGILDVIIGDAGRRNLYEHVRNADGKVTATAVVREYLEIVKGCAEGKK